jgi:hypothetical protein
VYSTISESIAFVVNYYSDYYSAFISKKGHYNEFLAINYNVQLLEKFIYFYYKVNVVRKGATTCLITSGREDLEELFV